MSICRNNIFDLKDVFTCLPLSNSSYNCFFLQCKFGKPITNSLQINRSNGPCGYRLFSYVITMIRPIYLKDKHQVKLVY